MSGGLRSDTRCNQFRCPFCPGTETKGCLESLIFDNFDTQKVVRESFRCSSSFSVRSLPWSLKIVSSFSIQLGTLISSQDRNSSAWNTPEPKDPAGKWWRTSQKSDPIELEWSRRSDDRSPRIFSLFCWCCPWSIAAAHTIPCSSRTNWWEYRCPSGPVDSWPWLSWWSLGSFDGTPPESQ